MNVNNLTTIYNINAGCPPGRIVVSHDCDVNTRTVEVFFRQGMIPLAISQDCTAKAAFVERQSNILINDNVPCTVTESGSVLIPVDNLHRQGRFDMSIELTVTNQGGEKVLVTPFPMWITVNGSILNEAEVTEESKGTVPELLEEAAEALAEAKDYEKLDNLPAINGHTLIGDQTAEDLGISGGTDDYNELSNKPQINGVVLSGNKTSGDLGVQNQLIPEQGVYILPNNKIGLRSFENYLKWASVSDGGDVDHPDLNKIFLAPAQTWSTSLPENTDCYVGSFAPNSVAYMVQVAFAIASKKTYIRTSNNIGLQKAWGAWEELAGGGSEIVSGVVNQNGTITFADSDGNTFTTTGESVIGKQGNSVTNAEILNNNLIIHIGVLQPDGTILDTPVDVGRVVGQPGAKGQHGDGYTAAQINADGDLIMTEVVYTAQGSTPMVRQINLGHVVGADGQDYVLTPQDKSDIADIVLSELPTTQGVLYGNSND